ncbi:hypothetical protein D3C71_1400530 [compost metagenome]
MFSSHQGNRETIEPPGRANLRGFAFPPPAIVVTAVQFFEQNFVETGRVWHLWRMAFACKLDQPRSWNQPGRLLSKDAVVTDLRLDSRRGNEALLCIKKGLA